MILYIYMAMSAKQQEVIDELNSEVQSLLRDWVGDLVDCHDYDSAMAELQVIEAANAYFDETDAADVI